MPLWSEPTETSGYGLGELRDVIAGAFSSHAETYRTLEFLLTFTDTLIYFLVAVTSLAFIVFLTLWATSGSNEVRRQKAVEGATRSFAALFLMVNIWGVVRLVNAVTYISPLTEYLIFFLFFLILGAWSLFNIGAGFLGLISSFVNAVVAAASALVARVPGESWLAQKIRGARPGVLRFVLIVVIAVALSPFWIPTFKADTIDPLLGGGTVPVAEAARGGVEGTTYTETGFSITYPEDWSVQLGESGSLYEATRDAIRSNATLYAEGEGSDTYLYSWSWRAEQLAYYFKTYELAGWNIYDIKAWEVGPNWYAIGLMANSASDPDVIHEATYVYLADPATGRMYLFTFEHDGAREDANYLYEAIAPIIATVSFE